MARRFRTRGTLDQPTAAAPPRPLVERLVELLFALCLAASVGVVLVESVQRAFAPYQVEFGEGNVLASAIGAARGEAVYPLPAAPPYVFSSYGPLLYAVEGLLVRAFGVSFTAPRLLSLLAMLGVTALLILLLRRWTGSWRVALLFGPLFLALPAVGLWVAVARADPLALLLSTAGLFAIATSPRRWPLAALLFVAALFVKPTFVAAPAASFCYLLARRERRAALGLAGLCAGLGLAALAALQVATRGGFVFQLVTAHPEPYSLRRYLRILAMLTRKQLVPVVMLAAFVWHDGRRRMLTLPLLFVTAATLGTLTAGMAGAASNHLLEWSAAVCLGTGLAYHVAGQSGRLWQVLRVCGLLAMAGSALLFSFLLWLAPQQIKDAAVVLPHLQRLFPIEPRLEPGCAELQRYLAARAGTAVLSENTGAALLAGKTLLVTDPYAYTQLVVSGKWRAAPLDDLIRARRIETIVLAHEPAKLRSFRWDRWPPALLTAIEQNYVVDRHFECTNGTVAYVPR